MDENHKRAYRDLLYFAMLDIRRHTPISPYMYFQAHFENALTKFPPISGKDERKASI